MTINLLCCLSVCLAQLYSDRPTARQLLHCYCVCVCVCTLRLAAAAGRVIVEGVQATVWCLSVCLSRLAYAQTTHRGTGTDAEGTQCKNIRISTNILWRVFHILAEPVPYVCIRKSTE